MSRFFNFIKQSYVIIIISIFYIPIFFSTVFSFNNFKNEHLKGDIRIKHWDGFSLTPWKDIFYQGRGWTILNSFILGTIVSLIVVFVSLLTVYSIWKQKNKIYKVFIDSTSNIPLINPDVITAISLSIFFSLLFGALKIESDGMWRAIVSHVTMILPYGIIIMYPKSEKFKISFLEASKDLGFGPFKTWIKTYLRFMLSISIITIFISFTLSFDDFILTRTTSNVSTIGTKLYEGSFKGWSLAIGSFMLVITLIGSFVFSILKRKKND